MRKIVFFGNCQAEAYGKIYRRHISPITEDKVTILATFANLNEEQSLAIREADIVVSQLFDGKQQSDLSNFPTSAEIIEFPNFYLGFLWPNCGRRRTISRKETGTSRRYGIELGDSFLDRLIEQGLSPNEITKRYLEADFSKNLDRYVEIFLDRQKLRDEKTGFITSDIIAARYRTERISYTPGHPCLRMARYIVEQLFERLNVDATLLKSTIASLTEIPLPKYTRPIHPSVAQHLDLPYGDMDEMIEMDDGELMSHEAWVWHYAAGSERLGLRKAIDQANSVRDKAGFPEAIQSLRSALLYHGPSGLALSILGHKLLEVGELDEGFSAFQQASCISPRNPKMHQQLAYALMKLGRTVESNAEVKKADELLKELIGDGQAFKTVSDIREESADQTRFL